MRKKNEFYTNDVVCLLPVEQPIGQTLEQVLEQTSEQALYNYPPTGSIGKICGLTNGYASIIFESSEQLKIPVGYLKFLAHVESKTAYTIHRYGVYCIIESPHGAIDSFRRMAIVSTEEEANNICLFPYDYGLGDFSEESLVVIDIPAGRHAKLKVGTVTDLEIYEPRYRLSDKRLLFQCNNYHQQLQMAS
jgi:phage baseplate assembly protein W